MIPATLFVSCPQPPPLASNASGWGFFLVVGAPPPYSVNRHPLPRPQTRVGGGFLLPSLPPPTPPSAAPRINAPGLHATSMPPACALRQRPQPARRINAPGLCAASMPLACAPRQCPRPARHVNAPGLRAASTPPPLPLRCAPASALTPPLGVLCQCPLLCKRRVCFPLPSFSLR